MEIINSREDVVNELKKKLVCVPEQVILTDSYIQDIDEIFNKVIEHNDKVITEIREVIGTIERNNIISKCKTSISVLHCFEECESIDDCYSELNDEMLIYFNKYLDSGMITSIIFDAIVRGNRVGVISKGLSAYYDAIEDYTGMNVDDFVKLKNNRNSEQNLFFNLGIIPMFSELIGDSEIITVGGLMNLTIISRGDADEEFRCVQGKEKNTKKL